MIQAYNLRAGLPVKREVLHLAKNRGELKRVYDKIVSLSSCSPFCLVNLSQENKDYTIGIKEAALELKDRINDMQDPKVSGFGSKAVTVSDESIISAKLLNEDTNSLPETIQIKVNQLADVQINRGKDLLNSSFAFPTGNYDFSAYVGDESSQITFTQERRMGNQNTMDNLAYCMNRSVPGISVAVEKGNSKDYSRFVIAANMTGRFGDKKFAFDEGTSDGEGIVDFFGLNRVAKEATTSDFELNGTQKQTATNTFNLENSLQITLKNKGEQPVTLMITQDSSKILTSVDSVVSAYNSLIILAKSRIDNNDEHYSANKLMSEMQSFGKVYQDELESVGINIDENGILSLNKQAAVQSAQDGGMESLFTRKNGFIVRLIDKAEAIAINPVDYLDKTIVLYPNNEKTSFHNPYVTSMYSGMLFSSYC
jgi:flagellar hook-associated protein 2